MLTPPTILFKLLVYQGWSDRVALWSHSTSGITPYTLIRNAVTRIIMRENQPDTVLFLNMSVPFVQRYLGFRQLSPLSTSPLFSNV